MAGVKIQGKERHRRKKKNTVTSIELTEKIVRNTHFSMRFLHTNT